MKRSIKFLAAVLAAVMVFSILPSMAFASSGKCGTNLTWTLDSNGTFTISGKGSMTNYKYTKMPWYNSRESIKRVVIENGVTSIGNIAFNDCENLTSVTIPDSVTSIGNEAFSITSITSITIPNSVTTIGEGAFSACRSLTSVTIPNSVKSIGKEAFFGCESLARVIIPDSVTSIGDVAFYGCSSLEKFEVDSNNNNYTIIDGVLFNKDKTTLIQYPIGNSRTTYEIPSGVTTIGNEAFHNCTFLTNVIIPDGVTTIGESALSWCYSLESVNIPDSVTSIGGWAFQSCYSLKSATIPYGVKSIEKDVFSYCDSLASVEIPNSVKSIDNWAFFSCDNLTDVYYTGSEAQWKNISTGYGNDSLKNATIHYNAVPVIVNGNRVSFDQKPTIVEGRTLVPLRAIFEALGAEVEWNNDTKTVTAKRGDTTVSLTIGSNKIYVNGTSKELEVSASMINNRTMVPARAVAEAFGCNVSWDNDTRSVIIEE